MSTDPAPSTPSQSETNPPIKGLTQPAKRDLCRIALHVVLWFCCAAIAAEIYCHFVRDNPTRWGTTFVAAFIGVSILVLNTLSSREQRNYTHKNLPPKIDWAAGKHAESLNTIFGYVFTRANDAVAWYQRSRRPMKRAGQYLRVGAILLSVGAAIIPLAAPIYYHPNPISPKFLAWSPVVLAVAGLFVLLDKFLGCTSAWVRYVAADFRIQKAMTGYACDWYHHQSQWGDPTKPTPAETKKILELTRAFAVEVDQAVADETQQWMDEFKSALKRIDDSVDHTPAPPKPKTPPTNEGGQGAG